MTHAGMNPHSAPRSTAAARSVARSVVVMPDVVRASPSSVRADPGEASGGQASWQCAVCQPACGHHASVNESSSAVTAARCIPIVRPESVDAAPAGRAAGVTQPLPDLVNVHQAPPPPYDDRPPTSIVCHARPAAAVNHYVPQQPAPTAPVHSPTHYCVRRVRAWSKLDCCEHSVARCMLSTAALKWSILILVSLGFACIIIGVILAVLQFTAGAQHDASSLVHAVILMGLGAALVVVVAVLWKCVVASSSSSDGGGGGRARSKPCRLLERLSERVARPSSSALRSARRVHWTSGRWSTCSAGYRHCDYAYWSAGADSPETQQQQRQPPPSYSASLHSGESTHGVCQLAGRHCADPASPPLVERAARARRLCVATLPGRSTCRLYVAGESVQCRMVPCTEMCRHNCHCAGSLQR